MKEGLKVIVSHGDCVSSLPPGARLLATSASCRAELFTVGHNVLACQSHPEFEVQYAIWERVWAIAVLRNGRLTAEERAAYEPGLRAYRSDEGADQLLAFIKTFLHS